MKTTILLVLVGITLFCGSVACNLATESVKAASLHQNDRIEAALGQ